MALFFGQPADARGKLTVINGTPYSAKVSIVYYTHLCKDDHPTVGPNSTWTVNSGLCEVKDSVVVLKDKNGKDNTCQSKRGHTLQAVWRIHIMNDMGHGVTPYCGVASA